MSLISYILRRVSIAVLLFCVTVALPASAKSPDFMAKVLDVKEGMSQNSIMDICRDSRGFVWIGTRYGVNRYDTYSIKHYFADETPESIRDNGIYRVFEDQAGQVWVLCSGVSSVYDPITDKFHEKTVDGKSVLGRSVTFVDDGFLLAGKGEIFHYTYADDTIRRLPIKGGSNEEYLGIFPWDDGTFMLHARRDGLWIYDPKKAAISRYEAIPTINIAVIRPDEDGCLWVAPYNNGVIKYDHNGNKLKEFTEANGMTSDMVIDISIDDEEVMIGTERGLNIIPRATETIRPSARSQFLKSYGSINRIYHDKYGNQYLGTVRNGMIIIQSTTMRTLPLAPLGEIENTVTSFVHGRNGEILGGIDGYGLVAFDPETYDVRTVEGSYGMKVINLAAWPDNKVIVSDWGSPLRIFDKETEKFSRIPAFLDSISEDAITNRLGIHFLNLPSGKLAAITDNVALIDPVKKTLTTMVELPHPVAGHLKEFYGSDSLVMVIRNTKILFADLKEGTLREIATSPDGAIIECAQYDGDDTIYAATLEHLYVYSISKKQFKHIKNDILHNIRLMYLYNGKLWLGANSKLFLWDKGRFVAFDEGNGVQPCEMRPTALFEDSTHVYFGSTSGVVTINKEATDSLTKMPPAPGTVHISELLVNGEWVLSDIKDGTIEVPAAHTSLTLKIIVSEPSPLRSKFYRFYFEGADIASPIESDSPYITVNDLPSGKNIEVKVSYTLSDGSWSEPVGIIDIKVRQLWWKSWWFTLILICMICAAGYTAFRMLRQHWKSDSDKQRRHMLERDVELLANINQGLRSPIDKIAAPINTAIEQLDGGNTLDREALGNSLREALEQVDMMHDMVDSPFEMLHPQNLSVTSMNLTARFNKWLVDQVKAFVRAHRIEKRIDYTFIPDCDKGTITFNASRLEIVINCLLAELLEAGYTHLQIGVSDDSSGNLYISFTYEGGVLPERDAMPSEGENLRLVYARWIAELDDDRVVTLIGEDGKLQGAILVMPAVKSQRTPSKAKTYREEAGGVVREYVVNSADFSDYTLFILESPGDTADFLRSCTEGKFRGVTIMDNVEEALRYVEEYIPDIVILDSDKNLEGSIELCRLVKSTEDMSTIPVIMLTAGDLRKVKEASFRYAADAYLEKPFDRSVLIDLCHTLLLSSGQA